MDRLLVTGGAGFIGSNFVRYLRRERPQTEIIVLDALTYAGDRANVAGIDEVELVVGDIRDRDLVATLLRERAIDGIVNFAAETHVDRSIAGPAVFIDTNVVGTHCLLEAARDAWLDSGSGKPHRFHHISTDEVFGSLGPEDQPSTEVARYAPNSPYSASKAAADHLVRAYRATYGLETSLSICSNNYGPRQYPEKLIPRLLSLALRGAELPVYGDGLNIRDWLHVDDHCRGIDLTLRRGRPGESYNIGGGCPLANIELVERVCDEIDAAFAGEPSLADRYPEAPAARGEPTRSLVRFVEDRPGHDRRYAIDDGKARAELGYAPLQGFDDGLRATVAWYLARLDG